MNALGYFRKDCRLCRSDQIDTFLDFGLHPHSDGFVKEENVNDPEPFFPLACAVCPSCGQVQLTYVVSPEFLYNQDYVYDGSVTQTGRDHFLGFASAVAKRFDCQSSSLAIDVGSNVGLLLSGFKSCGMRVLGVDPAVEPTKRAMEQGIDTVVKCFSAPLAKEIQAQHGNAKIITGTNVFAHIDDLDDFMQGVDTLLEETGVLVIEAPYILDLLEQLEYDTIYHQHLSYLSIKPLVKFFRRFGMELFDVERTQIHGGSIRLFVCRKDKYEVQPVVNDMVGHEEQTGMCSPENLYNFAKRVGLHRQQMITMLTELHDQGKKVVGIGAPAKGMTLLNYCGINRWLLPYITEKSPWKQGRFTPGAHIPIVPDEQLLIDQPDYGLILPWNFGKEIMHNLAEFRQNGGSFILPIPSPTIS